MQKIEIIVINGISYTLKIFFEKRMHSSLSINKNIIIRIPLSLTRDEQIREILRLKSIAIDHITKKPNKFISKAKVYVDKQEINVLDKKYILNITYNNKKTGYVKCIDNVIKLIIPKILSQEMQNKFISIFLNKIIAKEYLNFITQKVNFFNDLYVKSHIKSISLRKATSKLGSCSMDNDLMFSTFLLLAPEDKIDYVVVHELAHTIEHNHSNKFWDIVNKIIPDYKEKKSWLKDNARELII